MKRAIAAAAFTLASGLAFAQAYPAKPVTGPEFANVLKDTGSEYVGDSPENFTKFIQAELAKWAKVAKDSGATLD